MIPYILEKGDRNPESVDPGLEIEVVVAAGLGPKVVGALGRGTGTLKRYAAFYC